MKDELTLLERIALQEMTHRRFAPRGKRLIREAGEDPMADPMAGGPDPNAGADTMGGAGADPAGGMGGADPNAGGAGADPNAGGADPMAGGAGADPMAGGADPMADPMGGAGADPMAGGPDPLADGPKPDDDKKEDDTETLNIDDLTNSQEKMNNKINTIGRNQIDTDERIKKLLASVEDLKGIIHNNNQEIQRLQKDIIKRNPTPTEDLYLQSLASYPYNTNIADYWKDYADRKRDNYNIIAGGVTSKIDGGQDIDGDNADVEYTITADDLDDFSADDVYNSFSIGDRGEQSHNAFRPRF